MTETIEYELSCKVVNDGDNQNFHVILSIKEGDLVNVRAIGETKAHVLVGVVFFLGSMFSLLLTQLV